MEIQINDRATADFKNVNTMYNLSLTKFGIYLQL